MNLYHTIHQWPSSSDGNLTDHPEMVRSQQIDGGWGCMLLVRYRLRISVKCHRSGAGSVTG
jgi:hypothetical protein